MKHLIRLVCITLLLTLALNFRWVHAATVTLMAQPCDAELQVQAKDRVTALFGATLSQPLISCLNQATLGLNVSYGSTNFAPMLPAIVLIGPKGANIDVMAHEWAHAETSHRLGFLPRTFDLPVWVDEGLAMQVDHRDAYNLAALKRYQQLPDLRQPTAEELSTQGFFAASNQGKLHYSISRCAVSAWLTQNTHWLASLTTDRPTAINELSQAFNQCQ